MTQYPIWSLPTLNPSSVFWGIYSPSLRSVCSLVYAATGKALCTNLHRVGRAETPSCSNCGSESQYLLPALYLTLCVYASSAIPFLFLTSGPIPGGLPDYWDPAELIRVFISRNGSGKPTTTTTNRCSFELKRPRWRPRTCWGNYFKNTKRTSRLREIH